MIGDLSPEDDLLDQEYPPEGLMSEDDLNVTERYSKSIDYSEKVVIGSPKYGSPTSIRSRSSVRIMDKKASITNARKGSSVSLLEERARSPSLRRLSSANVKVEERARSPSLNRLSSMNRKTSVRPKTPSTPRPGSPEKAPETNNSIETRDELIKLHRQAIKENNDFSKQESKILVNLTMKMGKQLLDNPEGANLVDEAFVKYMSDLENILEKKMEGMMQLQNYISKLKN